MVDIHSQTSNRIVQFGGFSYFSLHQTKIMAKIASFLTGSLFTATANVPIIENSDKTITLDEVAWHDSSQDCWVIIYDRVYNVTQFLQEHPGGAEVLLEYAGRDASVAFRGTGHSQYALKALGRFFIGELPMHERIFRRPGGYTLSDIPD